MTAFARRLSILVALSGVLAGCGTHGLAGATALKSAGLAARATVTGPFAGRKPVKALANPTSAQHMIAIGKQLAAHGADLPPVDAQGVEDDAAPAAAPKVDDVAALLDLVSSYGYGGDQKHMVQSLHNTLRQYVLPNTDPNSPYYAPGGWDYNEYARIGAHFCYWLPTFNLPPVNNADDYATQALLIAQSRQDVHYYIWVSKPAAGFWDRQQAYQQGATSCQLGPAPAATTDPNPFAPVMNYAPIYTDAGGFNIVKTVGDGTNGWMVNIGSTTVNNKQAVPSGEHLGLIEDYFVMDGRFTNPVDLGNLIPIPTALYY